MKSKAVGDFHIATPKSLRRDVKKWSTSSKEKRKHTLLVIFKQNPLKKSNRWASLTINKEWKLGIVVSHIYCCCILISIVFKVKRQKALSITEAFYSRRLSSKYPTRIYVETRKANTPARPNRAKDQGAFYVPCQCTLFSSGICWCSSILPLQGASLSCGTDVSLVPCNCHGDIPGSKWQTSRNNLFPALVHVKEHTASEMENVIALPSCRGRLTTIYMKEKK